jgi:spore coat protein U-like protein
LPGEYELHLKFGSYVFGQQNLDPQLIRTISQFSQKVTVNRNNQQPVSLTLDFGQGGGKR